MKMTGIMYVTLLTNPLTADAVFQDDNQGGSENEDVRFLQLML